MTESPTGSSLRAFEACTCSACSAVRGRVVAPHCLDQGVVLDPLSSSDGKRGEQGSRALAFQSKDAGSVEQVDRTEQSDHHRAGRAAADRCRLRDA